MPEIQFLFFKSLMRSCHQILTLHLRSRSRNRSGSDQTYSWRNRSRVTYPKLEPEPESFKIPRSRAEPDPFRLCQELERKPESPENFIWRRRETQSGYFPVTEVASGKISLNHGLGAAPESEPVLGLFFFIIDDLPASICFLSNEATNYIPASILQRKLQAEPLASFGTVPGEAAGGAVSVGCVGSHSVTFIVTFDISSTSHQEWPSSEISLWEALAIHVFCQKHGLVGGE